MSSSRACSECGKPLPDGVPPGLCPECALGGALALSAKEVGSELGYQVGQMIGAYRLIERIGEGGYGVVYRAEQLAPLRRVVALKVIKVGMDTRSVIARFEAERQALALMDHPNIAKVLDAGATQNGRPYFVMELVEGVKITSYADTKKLSTQERLQLFVQVCRAVQHAHQKGIIHRDLKPSNVLVAVHDGVAMPKVIDFGIAKATQEPLTERTLLTGLEQFLGTPAYMSPEQAGLDTKDIDTRSDIYSLGVMLYELLTTHTPFERKELLESGLEEMRRVIREKEPPKPSTRLTSLTRERLAEVARTHRTEAGQLLEFVRGDLDWIVMKCLEKERGRRYESASGLSRDIERHLNNEPVTAAPPGAGYRAKKFVHRHQAALAVGTALLLLLLAGVIGSTWQAVRATRAERAQAVLRRKAELAEKATQAEALKSQQVARFLKSMLNGVGPSVALGRNTQLLREILDKTATRVGNDLKDQPEVEAELRQVIGQVYFSLAEYPQAEAMQRRALALRQQTHGPEHAEVAESLSDLGEVLEQRGTLAEAENLYRQALEMRQRLFGKENPLVAISLANLAKVLRVEGRLNDAEGLFLQALPLQKRLLDKSNPALSACLHNFAILKVNQGKFPEAEALFREALQRQRELLGPEDPRVANSLDSLSLVLADQGKFAEAEQLSREALALRRKVLGNEHADTALSIQNLATCLHREGKFAEAETNYLEALVLTERVYGTNHEAVAKILGNLALLLQRQARLSEAESKNREALAIRRSVFGPQHPWVAVSLNNLAAVVLEEGRPAEAEILLREALDMRRKLLGEGHPAVAESLTILAGAYLDQGKFAEAEETSRQALALNRKLLGREHPQVAASLSLLGHVLREEKKLSEAEMISAEALAIRTKALGPEHQDIAQSLQDRAAVLRDLHRLAQAEVGYRQALQMRQKLLGNDHLEVGESMNDLAALLQEENKLDEAEALSRQAVALYEKMSTNDFRTLNARETLGSILISEKQFPEAEALLLATFAGFKQLDGPAGMIREVMKQIAEDLVKLYRASANPEQTAQWERRAAELSKPQDRTKDHGW